MGILNSSSVFLGVTIFERTTPAFAAQGIQTLELSVNVLRGDVESTLN